MRFFAHFNAARWRLGARRLLELFGQFGRSFETLPKGWNWNFSRKWCSASSGYPPAATLLRLAPFQQVAHAFAHATHRTLPLRLPSHVSSITRLELDVMYLYLFRCASLLSFATSAGLPKLSQTAKTTQSVSMLATLALSSASQCVQIKSHISYICCGSDRGLTALFPLQIQLKFWLRSD